jgi:hypothetical protein
LIKFKPKEVFNVEKPITNIYREKKTNKTKKQTKQTKQNKQTNKQANKQK